MITFRYLAFLGLALLAWPAAARADAETLPDGPFPAARYSPLWETSPFAVATPVTVESAQYQLVGAAELEGISYLSLVDRQSQEHFVVTTNVPSHGLSLVDLTHGSDASSLSATLRKNGSILKLKLESGPSAPAGVAAGPPGFAPQMSGLEPFHMRFQRSPPRPGMITPPIYVPMPSGAPSYP